MPEQGNKPPQRRKFAFMLAIQGEIEATDEASVQRFCMANIHHSLAMSAINPTIGIKIEPASNLVLPDSNGIFTGPKRG